MQDNKALQAGTSHFLGQNFARAFDTQFQTEDGTLEYVWSTSWGVSTRLIGGLIMTHSDDVGLVCPPRLAPTQVIIVPIWRNDDQKSVVTTAGEHIRARLDNVGVRVDIDLRDGMKPGAKYFEWEARGVPLRLEVGPRDVESEQTVVARRTGAKEPVKLANLEDAVQTALAEMQASLFTAACDRREAQSVRRITKAGLIDLMAGDGGFAYGGYCGDHECETAIQQETKATVRVLLDEESRSERAPERCVWCGKPSIAEAVWAKAY